MYPTEQKVSSLSESTGTENTAFLIPICSDLPWRYEQFFHTENLTKFIPFVSRTGESNLLMLRSGQRPEMQGAGGVSHLPATVPAILF